MEILFQQEGSLGYLILMISLLVGLLYLLMPFFIWRIWYWSQQNNKHLKEMSANLELLIRDIAPDALPPLEVSEEKEEATEESAADATEQADEELFAEEGFAGDLSDDDGMDFSMSDEFEDVTDDIVGSEISDFTDGTSEDLAESKTDEDSGQEESEDDEELVMDFDDEPEEAAEGDQQEEFFSEQEEESSSEDDTGFSSDTSGFDFPQEETPAPSEIPVSEDASSDFTVEHFESNEEKSFEFEDVDDDAFSGADDTFPGEAPAPEESTEETEDSGWGKSESSTDDIWGEEASAPAGKPVEKEFSQDAGDVGSAFDEPAKKDESVGDVANSFLSDLEDKLNLDSFEEQPSAPPEPPPAPAPAPEPEPKPEPEPADSQATLFARCEGCGHKLAYKQALSGKRVRCPACRTAFALP